MNPSALSSPNSLRLLPESLWAASSVGHFTNLFWNHSDKPQPQIYLRPPPQGLGVCPSYAFLRPSPTKHQSQPVRGLRASVAERGTRQVWRRVSPGPGVRSSEEGRTLFLNRKAVQGDKIEVRRLHSDRDIV